MKYRNAHSTKPKKASKFLPIILLLIYSFPVPILGYGIQITNKENSSDLLDCTGFQITANPSSQRWPAVYESIVVWHGYRNRNYDIYGYDISTDTEFPITKNADDQT